MLDCQEMLCGKADELSYMGIQGREFLLVHQWDTVRGKSSAQLAQKDEDMSVL
jgi:hypothetical protein